jgi:syntaxin-binding protein 1
MSKEVYLATSHMITPKLFLRQVGDLSTDRRRLDLPVEKPPPKAPAHLFEREPQPVPQQTSRPPNQASLSQPLAGPRAPPPPTAAMGAMNLGPSAGHPYQAPNGSSAVTADSKDDKDGKLKKDKDKKKKHLHLFR